jgi:mono/diheme cytochrome c family protein
MPLPARISALLTGLHRVVFLSLIIAAVGPVFGQGSDPAMYSAGEKVFKGNCASCHKPDKDMTGPALKGAKARWEGKGNIHEWVKNSQAVVKSGNAYANELFNKWNKSVMTPNAVSDADIDAVLYFVDNYTPPAPPPGAVAEVPTGGPKSTSWQWLLILGLLFAIVWVSLRGVKNALKSAVSEMEGKGPVAPDTPARALLGWAGRNKAWASIIGLFIFSVFIVMAWNWAFRIGVYGGDTVEHYKPTQPIAFNHTLHAGKDNLAINCIYCHSSAEKEQACRHPQYQRVHELPQGGERGQEDRHRRDQEDL